MTNARLPVAVARTRSNAAATAAAELVLAAGASGTAVFRTVRINDCPLTVRVGASVELLAGGHPRFH